MTPRTIMIVAGDPSGDVNAAGLVKALAAVFPGAAFIGAGGPAMAEAGVQLSFNLTADASIGPVDIIKKLGLFRERCRQLAALAAARRPELVVLVDFYTFNHRLARQIRESAGRVTGWTPKLVQYTSPQVWASRPGRAEILARDIDLLLCFFPFEKDWYARRGTKMRVEFVGHPMFDRYAAPQKNPPNPADVPTIVLLPGSRTGELKRHLPVMLEAARQIESARPARFKLVAADERIASALQLPGKPKLEVQTGRLADALSSATLAIACTGTVTMECGYFGVPTVALYKTSPLFFAVARQLVTVRFLAMPNLLANEMIFPEFVQGQATGGNLARASLELLGDAPRQAAVRARLQQLVNSLGGPGSTQRAAAMIAQLVGTD
jgi:lipid-A-disaccharide synthase